MSNGSSGAAGALILVVSMMIIMTLIMILVKNRITSFTEELLKPEVMAEEQSEQIKNHDNAYERAVEPKTVDYGATTITDSDDQENGASVAAIIIPLIIMTAGIAGIVLLARYVIKHRRKLAEQVKKVEQAAKDNEADNETFDKEVI